jgi:hypothetical protein
MSLVSTMSPRLAADAITTASTGLGPAGDSASAWPASFARSAPRGSTSNASSSRASGPRWPRHH